MVNLYQLACDLTRATNSKTELAGAMRKAQTDCPIETILADTEHFAKKLQDLQEEFVAGRRIQRYGGLKHYFGQDETDKYWELGRRLDIADGMLFSKGVILRKKEDIYLSSNFGLVAPAVMFGGSAIAIGGITFCFQTGIIRPDLTDTPVLGYGVGYGMSSLMAAFAGFLEVQSFRDTKNCFSRTADELEKRAKYVSEVLERMK